MASLLLTLRGTPPRHSRRAPPDSTTGFLGKRTVPPVRGVFTRHRFCTISIDLIRIRPNTFLN